MLKEGTWEWAVEMMKNGYRITRDEWGGNDCYDIAIDGKDLIFIPKIESRNTLCIAMSSSTIGTYSKWDKWKIVNEKPFNLGDL